MAHYYTTKKQDVIDAVRQMRRVEWYVVGEWADCWKLNIQFWIGPDDIIYQGRGFRASSETEARRKGEAQFVRLTTGRNISRPKQSAELTAARAALQAKVAALRGLGPGIKNVKVDWQAGTVKVMLPRGVEPGKVMGNYEPEFSRFVELLKTVAPAAAR